MTQINTDILNQYKVLHPLKFATYYDKYNISIRETDIHLLRPRGELETDSSRSVPQPTDHGGRQTTIDVLFGISSVLLFCHFMQ